MVESAWTTTAHSCDMLFREHTGNGEWVRSHVRMAARCKQTKENEVENMTLAGGGRLCS